MPHPTPYSRQFNAIRSAFPRLFERPGDEAQPLAHADGSDTTTESQSEGVGKPEGK